MGNYLRVMLAIAMSVLAIGTGYARGGEICGTMKNLQIQMQKDTGLAVRMQQMKNDYQNYLARGNKNQQSSVITIPVVVHVVHDGSPLGVDENITDAQILTQIDALNKDFRLLNADTASIPAAFKSLAADFEIEFCMAIRDPDGLPTNGITRTNGGKSVWDMSEMELFKPTTIWNPHYYLNIWVVHLGGADASTLGYAQFPGMADSTDGIVISYRAFGTVGDDLIPHYDLGRTTTHEIGHWLGLRHIWGDGDCNVDDDVADTPLQEAENFGCPPFPHISCSNGPNGDMFMNYMDYTDDDCSHLFTIGQKIRAHFFLSSERDTILTSGRCELLQRDIAITDLIAPTEEMCTDHFIPVVEVKNAGSQTIQSMLVNYQVDGGALNQFLWQGSIGYNETRYIHLPLINLPLGTHTLYVFLNAPNNNTDQNIGNDEVTINFNLNSIGIGQPVPNMEGFEGSTFIPVLWSMENPDGDRTWERDTAASGFGESTAAAHFDNFTGTINNNPGGTRDGLVTPEYDFRTANWPYITFNVAYAMRDAATADSLVLYYSVDCGNSWKRYWAKGGAELATAPNQINRFIPQDNQWREELVGIKRLEGQYKVKFKFENVSDWGNDLYLDDILIAVTPVGIDGAAQNNLDIKIFPNPNDGRFWVKVKTEGSDDYTLQVFNALGQMVYVLENASDRMIDLSPLGKGIYIVRVSAGDVQRSRKLVIN